MTVFQRVHNIVFSFFFFLTLNTHEPHIRPSTHKAMQAPTEKKKFERKVAPSKAPGRLLKKKLRDLERLLQNKDKLKDLPEEVVEETKKKIEETKKQIATLGPAASPAVSAVEKKNEAKAAKKSSNGLKFTGTKKLKRYLFWDRQSTWISCDARRGRILLTRIIFRLIFLSIEMRRAGRKISAYKKQHPNFEASEEESKAVADLELDLLYIKVSGLGGRIYQLNFSWEAIFRLFY